MARQLPPWLNHFNPRDLKTLFRCCVAAWVAAILIFINPALQTIGTATFFACFTVFMIPPSGILLLQIFLAITILIGLGISWAWGVIAMKAALAARPSSETAAKLQLLQQTAVTDAKATGQSPTAVAKVLIFEGFMLDTRVSVIYFVFGCVLIYFLARLRAQNQKLAFLQIFATIITDLFMTIGPLLYEFQGTMPKALIIPAAIGMGISLVCAILFFPQTTSQAVLSTTSQLMALMQAPLQESLFELSSEVQAENINRLQQIKGQALGIYRSLEAAVGFLPLDICIGRWNAEDLRNLKQPLREALLCSMMLLEYHVSRVKTETKLSVSPADSTGEKEIDRPVVGRHQLMDSALLLQAFQDPKYEALRTDTIQSLRQTSTEIRQACLDAIAAITESIKIESSNGLFATTSAESISQQDQRNRAIITQLEDARSSFAFHATEGLIGTHTDLFDSDGSLKAVEDPLSVLPSLRGITMGMVYEERIIAMARSLEGILRYITALREVRQKKRIWFPTKIRYAVSWASGSKSSAPVPMDRGVNDPDAARDDGDELKDMLRTTRGSSFGRRRGLGKAVLGAYHWLICPEGMFGLRMVVVTIALAVPAVIPSSAGFYYREKGIWALIMGQTTLLIYMADFTFSLISRVIGTVVGGLLGLVTWYIGSGNGGGNPYGLSAMLAVSIVILMWTRVFLPPATMQATIMSAATCLLVIGYSYDDKHVTQYSDTGLGYSVFWRRLVLVFIGSTAALVVQVFPRPPSAAQHISKSLANVMGTLADHYALFLSSWNQEDRKLDRRVENLSLHVAESLVAMRGPIALLQFEFSSSPFNSAALTELSTLCHCINRNLGQLLVLTNSLPITYQERFIRTMGILDHPTIGVNMAIFSVIQQALRTGLPLPEFLPTPLIRQYQDYWRVHGEQLDLRTDHLRQAEYRMFCVAIHSYLDFVSALDDLVLVAKQVLGETHIVSENFIKVA
ncbi:hypothetical protein ASPZODRAFT_127074 [Penicilliopsis zonata CBS 506.65]|uniref:ER transporter 6TM N-terminal domain-containing protein n=1 Tax=Penicilliopsis zonata CBS 506.65 TaxID=1073090 RepID=A0A1L9SV49_9EURO|nr:hypothetical protein ASPZODRAFT_127074 [Penicilliopsis zonata CBS 506.65]OJJ51069.1 hypothetical protein ASPZODRAFT_127074 [Penicilliopsis zonata CBS 506.65]